MNAPNDETPGGRGKGFQSTEQNGQRHSIKTARFQGTDNPRYLRAIAELLRRPRKFQDMAVPGMKRIASFIQLCFTLRSIGLARWVSAYERYVPEHGK